MVNDTRRAVIVTGLSAIGVGAGSRSGSVTGGASIDAGEIELSDLELVDTNDNNLIGLDVLDDETIVARGIATNVGDVEEIFEIWLALELDGAWTDLTSKEYDIKAKEAKQVELSADLSSELAISQDYPSTPVYLGGVEIGTIDLLQSGPNIQITGAWLIDGSGNRVESLTVQEGDPITAETDLTNDGNESGEQLLELTYDGTVLDSATVAVDPGQEITQQLVGEAPQVDGDQTITLNVENQRAGDVTVENAIPESALAQNAFAYYDFQDDTDTTTLTDNIGTNDGSITGMSYVQDGDAGRFVGDFDGTDDIVDGLGIKNLSAYSIGMIIKPTDTMAGTERAIHLQVNNSLDISIDPDGNNWRVTQTDTGDSNTNIDGGPYEVDSLQTIVARWDGSTMSFSVDGETTQTASISSMRNTGNNDSFGGRASFSDDYMPCRLVHIELSDQDEGSSFEDDFHAIV